jgi:hypothetical protein
VAPPVTLLTSDDLDRAQPTGALQNGYDAARKAAIALLAAQGLRGPTDGGHRTLRHSAAAQFDGTFDRLGRRRRRRDAAEYPNVDTPEVSDADARDANRRRPTDVRRRHRHHQQRRSSACSTRKRRSWARHD